MIRGSNDGSGASFSMSFQTIQIPIAGSTIAEMNRRGDSGAPSNWSTFISTLPLEEFGMLIIGELRRGLRRLLHALGEFGVH